MSENEKRLRGWLALGTRAAMTDVLEALDALLGEHRAEVKELQTLLVGKKAGALEVYAAGEVDAKVDAASDAALEEAARQYEAWAAENCQHESPTPEKRIRALKLQPAERYLRESEVREVLRDLLAYGRQRAREARESQQSDVGGRMVAWAAEQAGDRLGVDLDAEEEKAPHDALVVTDGATATVLNVPPGFRVDTRQTCTCTGSCRGPEGLGAGWKCALGRESP